MISKIAAWLKKHNVKVTWKSLVGVAFAATGVINVIVASGLPNGVSKLFIAVGAGLLAFERIADAIDYRSDSQFNSPAGVAPGTPPAAPPPAA